jgi:hypothetical protein
LEPVSLSAAVARLLSWVCHTSKGRIQMPIILWLLGVPLTIVLLLMLFGVL